MATLRQYNIVESSALGDFECGHCQKQVKEGEPLARVYVSRLGSLFFQTEQIKYTCGWACGQCFITSQENRDVQEIMDNPAKYLTVDKFGVVRPVFNS